MRACYFCYGFPPGHPKIGPIIQEMVCAAHWQQFMDSVDEWLRSHPEKKCTETCGCVSLEELNARLALP